MRGIVALVLIVLLFAVLGWVSFGSDGERSSINLETRQIREDTNEAVERTEDAVEAAKEEWNNSKDSPQEPSD